MIRFSCVLRDNNFNKTAVVINFAWLVIQPVIVKNLSLLAFQTPNHLGKDFTDPSELFKSSYNSCKHDAQQMV